MLPSEERNARMQLLAQVLWFVPAIARLDGVRKIALLGSILTTKKNPKDIDFLVMVDDDTDLARLARVGRQLKGRAQQINRGADIFLIDPKKTYIGRTCSWRECRPRVLCDALNCGKRPHLHDDLKTVSLSPETIEQALQLWPVVETREGLPLDLKEIIAQIKNSEIVLLPNQAKAKKN